MVSDKIVVNVFPYLSLCKQRDPFRLICNATTSQKYGFTVFKPIKGLRVCVVFSCIQLYTYFSLICNLVIIQKVFWVLAHHHKSIQEITIKIQMLKIQYHLIHVFHSQDLLCTDYFYPSFNWHLLCASQLPCTHSATMLQRGHALYRK